MAKSTIKGITTKRIKDIIAYGSYVERTLCNVNTIHKISINPIGATGALATLKDLRTELDGFKINIKEIDCNRVFGEDLELTDTEKFIVDVCDYDYICYKKDYNKIKEVRELDKEFPRKERQKLANDLEQQIKNEYRKITTVGKINKTLRKASELKVKELGAELRDVLATLEAPTEEYINNMLYLIADSKINEIKSKVEEKIVYLESAIAMEEIA